MNDISGQVARAAAALRRAKRVLVLTGAGVSKESGIPTYRDALTGLWSNYSFEQLASPEGFRQDPAMVWDWYAERRQQLRAVQPNAGHIALARLGQLLPAVQVVTQNVDDLHERAGSTGVLHLHGSITQTQCFFHCRGNPTLVEESQYADGPPVSPPPCPYCGRWLRPAVVWFGEMLPHGVYEQAHQAAVDCDVCLVAGTSGMVFPAAQLPLTAKMTRAFVININPEDEEDPLSDVHLRGPFGQLMPALLDALERHP